MLAVHNSLSPATSLNEVIAPVRPELNKVKLKITANLLCSQENINQIIAGVSSPNGKMLRAALVLIAANATGRIKPDHIKTAAAVEMIHTATLLHDDVIDQAQSRRNQPTLNHSHGNKMAVLAGDYVLSKTYMVVSKMADRKIGKLLADTAVKICTGEMNQSLTKNQLSMSVDQYIAIIADKTASFMAASARLGAIINKADDKKQDALKNFGHNIGLAFQITDDILDLSAKTSQTGKTGGLDLAQMKITLPLIYYLQSAENSKKQRISELLMTPKGASMVEKMLRKSDALDRAMSKAQQFCKTAVSYLDVFENSSNTDPLKTLADFVLKRSY